jgi:hypothetical protein
MGNVRKIENVNYVEVDALMIKNAIRIYQHWKQLDGELRAISTRGINFPSELSELFACYILGFHLNKGSGGDAYDYKNDRIIEMKGSGSEKDDLSSFSPSETFDELIFIKVNKDEDKVYVWCTGVDSDELKKIKVNSRETVEDHQKVGKRPRFSVEKQIIREKGLKPNYEFDILEKKITKL